MIASNHCLRLFWRCYFLRAMTAMPFTLVRNYNSFFTPLLCIAQIEAHPRFTIGKFLDSVELYFS